MGRYVYTYELVLPVFKQGDDLADELDKANGDSGRALEAMAERYRRAAQACEDLAVSTHVVTVTGDTHCIDVEGPRETLDALHQEGLLHRSRVHVED
jgi:hypothetical protein